MNAKKRKIISLSSMVAALLIYILLPRTLNLKYPASLAVALIMILALTALLVLAGMILPKPAEKSEKREGDN